MIVEAAPVKWLIQGCRACDDGTWWWFATDPNGYTLAFRTWREAMRYVQSELV